MPAFDPVRDAVLNSPVTQPQALQLEGGGYPDRSLELPSPTTTSSRPSSSHSPSLTRRATDLAVLLNSEPHEPRTPSSTRPSSLSHLLLSDDFESEKLNSAPSFQRRLPPAIDIPREDHSFSRQLPPGPSRSSLSSSSPFSLPSDVPSSSSRILPTSPLTRTPMVSKNSALSSSSSSTPQTTSSPTMRSTLPYNPRQRLTPAGSVLAPMTQDEIQLYKNYRGIGTQRLMNKRKRAPSRESDDIQERPAKRHAGDVEKVVDHYNLRPEVGVKQRKESPIIGLKNFNNWVKSVLITQFGHPALAAAGTGKRRGKVLDMGCGKGGDLIKWGKARIREMLAVDIANVSVEQARQRWESMRTPRFDASFAALDCYTEPLTKAFTPQQLAQPFDVVSMQFCMHYAFETSQKARCMLKNVSEWLRPGGVFLGTVPNADQLLARLDQLPPDSKDLSFGNSVYKIRFEERTSRPLFGHRYYFYLRDAVEDVPEYIVEWDNFVEMAAQYGLHPVFKKEFHEVFQENREHDDFKQLMVRMNVCDASGASSMDDEEWEAVNIYIAFAFEKA